MIFISTCSQDTTTDIVMNELDSNDVLRFNIDRPEDYVWDFNGNGFRIADKANGKVITDKSLTSFYLRKPMYLDTIDVPQYGCVENWRREETTELFNDFFRECQSRNLVALVCSKNGKYGKLRQLLAAKKILPHRSMALLPRRTARPAEARQMGREIHILGNDRQRQGVLRQRNRSPCT